MLRAIPNDGGLNCASDGIQIDIGGTDSLTKETFFYKQIAKTKTKIKTNFPYQHTLLNIPNDGGLNCASDGIQIHIGGTDSLRTLKLC